MDHDPKTQPEPGDVLHKWNRNWYIEAVSQGYVYYTRDEPAQRPRSCKTSIQQYLKWATDAEVEYVAPIPPETLAARERYEREMQAYIDAGGTLD